MEEIQLLEIDLPQAVVWYSFSGLTWGLLIGFLVAIVTASYWFFVIRKRSKKYLIFKEIFFQLNKLILDKKLDNHITAQRIDELLKRAAMSFLDDEVIKKLDNNEIWFDYLNNQVKSNFLDETCKNIFIKASYQPNFNFDREQYLIKVKAYLKSLKNCI